MAGLVAPAIKSVGDKHRDDYGWGKSIRTQQLETAIMNGLGGRDMAALKIMFFLTGNADGFRVAEQTICSRCNITQPNYINARKKLVEMGWITHQQGCITVNYDNILNTYCNDMSYEEIEEETYRNDDNPYCNDMSNTYCNDMHNNINNNINNNIILPSFAELQAQARAGLI